MKALFFLLLSTFGLLSNASSFGCQNTNMNQLCLSKVVENCYTCEHLIPQKSLLEPVCVPLFHNNLEVLENYPVDKWNCTLYRPQTEINDEFMSEIGELENESKLIDDVCQVDNFISTICGDEDKNGFCMIANYIDDICRFDEEDEGSFDLKEISLQKYESPWGYGSECNQYFYIEICTNEVAKFCFDCRKFLGKEFFSQKPRYHYYCSPFYKDMDEKEAVNWLSKEKYECKRWINPNYKYKTSSFSVQNYETKGKLYSACTGPICKKEGWFYRGDHFGKEWCGMGKCKEYGNRVLCDFPTNCGKKMNSIESNFNKQFQTLGCGKGKFKCLLNKDCRQLVRRIDDCDKDLTCLFNLLIEPSVSENKIFFDLVQCMIPSH
jgi:hypothetical protein